MNLAAIVFHHQVEALRVPAVAEIGQGGQISRNQAAWGGRPGQGDQSLVDGFRLTVQPNPFQGDGLSLEGRGVDNLTARLGVGTLERHQRLRIGKNPFLRAAALGHTGISQIGAGGTVQNVDASGNFFLQRLPCQHGYPSQF